MSRFYIDGKNERSRGFFKKGGRKELTAHIRGWNKGVEIIATVNAKGLDQFEIWESGGTNGGPGRALIKTIIDKRSSGPRNPKGQLK
jgi:hypothetical protein